jgi:hypothetical protein
MSEENGGTKVGAVSLWAGVGGIIVPILIAILGRLFMKTNDEQYNILCLLLFAGAEWIALVTGIIGRRSAYGKAGLCISSVCVVATVLAVGLFLPVVRRVEGQPVPMGSPTSHTEPAR